MNAAEVLRANSLPLEPLATGTSPRLVRLESMRAVLFDVYGTLFVSASGDISLTSGASKGASAIEACQQAGIAVRATGDRLVAALVDEIHRQHGDSEFQFPEVDIHDVWARVIETVNDAPASESQIARLAIEYETRVNPVWPMPGMVDCLNTIRKSGMVMGIVSNAQSFTRTMFPALTGSTADEFGFADDLCVWSYEYLQAKPDRELYEIAADALADRGIDPQHALYIGNDMRNDIAPAAAVGFRTALFAGDSRSLRLREGDPLTRGVEPDAIVTDLRQILDILCLASLLE